MAHQAAWEPLGADLPIRLTDARLQLHWATQIVAAVPATYAPPVPDHSHTSLSWDGASASMVTAPIGRDRAVQAGLRLPDLALVLHDAAGSIAREFPLEGHTLAEGYAWMEDALTRTLAREAHDTALPRRSEGMPAHSVGSGSAFAAGSRVLVELAHWYGNAALLLEEVRRKDQRASPVRIWPHHFDIATLIAVDAGGDPEQARSVGVGMTPGDDSYDQPYFYVLPWPAPQRAEFPALEGGGKWHREGWVGAVLTSAELVGSASTAERQRERARAFLTSAVSGSRELLGSSG